MTKEIPRYDFGIIKQGTEFPSYELQATGDLTFANFTAKMTIRKKNAIGDIIASFDAVRSIDNRSFKFPEFKAVNKPDYYVLDVVFTNTVTNTEEVFLEGTFKIDHRIKPQS